LVFRPTDSPETLGVVLLQTRTRVEKAQELLGELQAATESSDRRVKETERRIIESDELIEVYRSSFSHYR
jgi:hypothetical protein